MRLLALVKSREHVCTRYRIAQFQSKWEQQGYRLDIRPWPKFWLSRLLTYRAVPRADVLIIQRRLFPIWQLNWLRARAQRLVFDFDDAIFLNNSLESLRGAIHPRRLARFRHMLELADCVVAGNAFLREQASQWAPGAKIVTIPTCVEARQYVPRQAVKLEGGLEMVWIGSSTTLAVFAKFAPILENLGKSATSLTLKVLCDRSLPLEHLPVQWVPWCSTTEAQELAAADVGISWLPDDPWTNGKCGLKVLQYMAAGLPVIANPVGVHREIVRHGETGLLARTADEWHAAVQQLARDPELRRRMGEQGRRRVQANYDTAAGAQAWHRVLTELHAPRRLDQAA